MSDDFSQDFQYPFDGAAFYVTIDDRIYSALQFGARGAYDSSMFAPSYVPQPVPEGQYAPYGWLDLTERPKPPAYSRLWSRFLYPLTPIGIFLWQSGDVRITDSWYSDMFLSADDRILGGHRWYALSSSWQAQVLTDAGYPLTRYEGPFA